MTNGEKMRAVFPDIKMWGESKGTLDYSLGGMVHRVMKSWWNAEYKESSVSEKPNKWIPVSEKLPKDKTYVLTTIKVPNRIAHVRSGWYEGGFFHNDNGDTWKATDMEVKAWMPAPKAYKGGKEK